MPSIRPAPRAHTAALCAFAVVGALAVGGCGPREKSSDAKIVFKYGGYPWLTVGSQLGEREVQLPLDDGPTDATKVTTDDRGHLFYRTTNLKVRVIYAVGDAGYFVGPISDDPPKLKELPSIADAGGTLFRNSAGTRRTELATAIQKVGGGEATMKMLLDSTELSDRDWEAARKTLPPDNDKAFRDAMVMKLESNDPWTIARAAKEGDITAPARLPLVKDKLRALLKDSVKQPRAAAALMRAVIQREPETAGQIACSALDTKYENAPQNDQVTLFETYILALAVSNVDCTNSKIEAQLENACHSYLRCGDNGSLAIANYGDEPLCTRPQLEPTVKAEVAEAPADVFIEKERPDDRPALWAYYYLLGKSRVPAQFQLINARRRYAIKQVSSPECAQHESNTPCHCEEPILREDVCASESHWSSLARCHFKIDDKSKTISDVHAQGF